MTPPIEIHHLSKTYQLGFLMNRKVPALKSLTLRIEPGQVYGLLGPNGAGKSTTIKILMNLVQPTAGEAKLFGKSPADPGARREVGFLPENPAPYEYLTGEEMVRLAGQLAGMSGASLDARVKEVVAAVGMERGASLQIRRYSKGMLQRISLAQALVHRPKLLILDEPTSGLDPVGRREMRDLILEEKTRGTTILFCTHIIPDVEALCDRLAVLVAGTLVKEGSVQELVTTQTPSMELILEGVGLDAVKTWGHPIEHSADLGNRLLLRTNDASAQAIARQALASGARISNLQPARFSLEDLFLDTLKKAGHSGAGASVE